VGFLRRHHLLTGALIFVVLVFGVLATTALAVWRAAHTDDARHVQHADLVIVLGAAQYNGTPSPVFQARLAQARLLIDEGFADRILVVGGGRPGDATTEAQAGQQWLISKGVAQQDVFAEPKGSTTFESLQAAVVFMRGRDLATAFLVSDPWHNLRIRRMASDLGISAYISATGRSAASTQWTRLQGYTRETFAYLYYRIFHR
jgi:uncharacterized SAM-binding protein YcdF (DUF218 family)